MELTASHRTSLTTSCSVASGGGVVLSAGEASCAVWRCWHIRLLRKVLVGIPIAVIRLLMTSNPQSAVTRAPARGSSPCFSLDASDVSDRAVSRYIAALQFILFDWLTCSFRSFSFLDEKALLLLVSCLLLTPFVPFDIVWP
jgi:hypothetical protein